MSHRSSVSVACFHTRVLRGCAFRGDRCHSRERLRFYQTWDASDSLVFYPVAASTSFVSLKGNSRNETARPDRKGRDDDIVACAWERRYRLGVPIFHSRNSPGAARGRSREKEKETKGLRLRLQGWFALRRLSCVLPSILRRA